MHFSMWNQTFFLAFTAESYCSFSRCQTNSLLLFWVRYMFFFLWGSMHFNSYIVSTGYSITKFIKQFVFIFLSKLKRKKVVTMSDSTKRFVKKWEKIPQIVMKSFYRSFDELFTFIVELLLHYRIFFRILVVSEHINIKYQYLDEIIIYKKW